MTNAGGEADMEPPPTPRLDQNVSQMVGAGGAGPADRDPEEVKNFT